jgi:hypothetical protein
MISQSETSGVFDVTYWRLSLDDLLRLATQGIQISRTSSQSPYTYWSVHVSATHSLPLATANREDREFDFIYARTSLPGQHPENQLLDLRKLAAQRGFEVVRTYCDHGISGSKARRPGLDAMMADGRR